MPEDKDLVCCECGSDDFDHMVWVNNKTKEVVRQLYYWERADEAAYAQCHNCNQDTFLTPFYLYLQLKGSNL